jgi:hypothetical protein
MKAAKPMKVKSPSVRLVIPDLSELKMQVSHLDFHKQRRDTLNRSIELIRCQRDLASKSKTDTNLNDDAALIGALRALEWIRDGYDPRPHFGISPRLGRPAGGLSNSAEAMWIVICYAKLRNLEPMQSKKYHRGIIASVSGFSDSAIRSAIKAELSRISDHDIRDMKLNVILRMLMASRVSRET